VPRLRRIALAVALIASGGAAAGAALAADRDVVARDSAFSPATVALQPGDTLTIRHDDRLVEHELKFSDEAAKRQEAGIGWTVARTFTAAEQRDAPYVFSCGLHPGMSGRVYVNATGTVPTPSATPSVTSTATATATSSASPGSTATPGAGTTTGPAAQTGGGGAPSAALRTATVSPKACVRRGPRCTRPGVRLRVDLSAPAEVHGKLRRKAPGARRFKAFGGVRFGRVAAGPRTLRFTRNAAGRRLLPGRYSLALRAGEARRTLSFLVL
jgi:plastocyanin